MLNSYVKFIISISLLFIFFGLEGIYPHFKGRCRRIKHALPNLIMASFNGFILQSLFLGVMLTVMSWSDKNFFVIKGIFAFILFDLWMYLWHLANHKIHFLWRFHRVHHTDTAMDTTTALRFHPVEILLSSLLRLAVVPIIGMNYIQLIIYETALQPIILFHHSNIALPEKWDRILRFGIVTPNMHRVHHSKERFETDSNYSSIFSFWDLLFGTFKKKENTLSITYGLTTFREEKWQQLWGALSVPFIPLK